MFSGHKIRKVGLAVTSIVQKCSFIHSCSTAFGSIRMILQLSRPNFVCGNFINFYSVVAIGVMEMMFGTI